jgi:formamidopyrimidine-DNA glycosylase
MPELPEVENVVRSIASDFKLPLRIKALTLNRKDLRWPFEKKKLKALENLEILSIGRRAKYILFQLKDQILISHLGMTGRWTTINTAGPRITKKHDHVVIDFSNQKSLVYNDPRRFGFLHVVRQDELDAYFSDLGAEPFQPLSEEIIGLIKKSDRSIKQVLLDQKVVVGIGNIYACEALFRAGIRPQTKAKTLSQEKIQRLYACADQILLEAISAGGSSITNYLNAKQEKGAFQLRHLVYGRESEPCAICQAKIRRITQAGRSTFWCKSCQK